MFAVNGSAAIKASSIRTQVIPENHERIPSASTAEIEAETLATSGSTGSEI
jgi:hypothetical protein